MSTEQPDPVPENYRIDNPYQAMAEDAALEHTDASSEKLEALPIGELIEQALSSHEFKELLQACPDDKRDQAIGWAVEFSIVSRDPETISSYLDGLNSDLAVLNEPNGYHSFETKKAEAIVQHMSLQLGLTEPLDEAGEEAVFDAVQANYRENGYYFHSFNGVFTDSIQQNGLHPHERMWDEADLEQVQQIGNRVGESMLLGWSNLNSAGQISISGDPGLIYGYSVASPEWFAQFTGEGAHIPPKPEQGYDKKAFYRRDHEAARKNLELLCDKISARSEKDIAEGRAYPNLTSDERDRVMSLFEKYWPVLAGENSQPKLALIERQAIEPHSNNSPSYARTKEIVGKYDSPNNLPAVIKTLISPKYHDLQIDHPIPPEQLITVSLPEYNDVHPKS